MEPLERCLGQQWCGLGLELAVIGLRQGLCGWSWVHWAQPSSRDHYLGTQGSVQRLGPWGWPITWGLRGRPGDGARVSQESKSVEAGLEHESMGAGWCWGVPGAGVSP